MAATATTRSAGPRALRDKVQLHERNVERTCGANRTSADGRVRRSALAVKWPASCNGLHHANHHPPSRPHAFAGLQLLSSRRSCWWTSSCGRYLNPGPRTCLR